MHAYLHEPDKLMKPYLAALTVLTMLFCGCSGSPDQRDQLVSDSSFVAGTFGYDLAILKKAHDDLVLLEDGTGARVLIAPAYQGRVMTSTFGGDDGTSNGWINHALISSGKIQPHMHAVGGEERFWLGPEGGQFGLYFAPGANFTFDQWQVPPALDTEPFLVLGKGPKEAVFGRDMALKNQSGTSFNLRVRRAIRILDHQTVSELLGTTIDKDHPMVAFESDNRIFNTGSDVWKEASGLLSIWILSMLNSSEHGIVGIPYHQGSEQGAGRVVTDDYFGKVPAARLVVTDSLILFRADGKYRSKIGLSPTRAMDRMFGYDPETGDLTIAIFSAPQPAAGYVNSKWERQQHPFSGDAVNAYNDGPNDSGARMGNFYELESSSPAAGLAPGDSLLHLHRTIHFGGGKEKTGPLLRAVFGISARHLQQLDRSIHTP